MKIKSEIRNSKFETRLPIERPAADSSRNGGAKFSRIRRLFRRLRQQEDIEQAAALNRAERLFAVNFRSTWTR